ncbi:glycosyltransferase family 2 protein [Winogradskyella sp. 3972H.M.0a.05]|uniref:glycosyltransferase family 2 protein n=1 Tax=Winogradskyella sp. 3972H.M.0a.05 TaxID=2950277 RepID=UPI0033965CF9
MTNSKLKYRFQKLRRFISCHWSVAINRAFNATVRQQIKNPKTIPIVIISYNQLEHLKKLINALKHRGYQNIVILDNASTYPPLLEYFDTISNSVEIHKLKSNDGHLSFWKNPDITKQYTRGYYVVTDPDIVPLEECPEDFMHTFRALLDKAYDVTKVGFSLKIDDIPNTNPNKENIENWESQFWNYKPNPKAYKAEIDTTFALYRPKYTYKKKRFTKAWRTDQPYQASHGSWYIDINALTEEQEYYMKTANESASWQIDSEGELVNKVHKSIYTND